MITTETEFMQKILDITKFNGDTISPESLIGITKLAFNKCDCKTKVPFLKNLEDFQNANKKGEQYLRVNPDNPYYHITVTW